MTDIVTKNWWICENIVDHRGQIGLLNMGFPRVFVLVRDYSALSPTSFEEFCEKHAELNFLNPAEREGADVEEIMTDAWNFLAIEEAEEERLLDRVDEDI